MSHYVYACGSENLLGIHKGAQSRINAQTSTTVVFLHSFRASMQLYSARSLAHLINRKSRGEKDLELWTKIIPQHLFALFHMLHMAVRLKETGFQKYGPI